VTGAAKVNIMSRLDPPGPMLSLTSSPRLSRGFLS
jgi:hypothetical protein